MIIKKFLHDRSRDVVQHITNNLRERYPQSAKKIKQVNELGIFTFWYSETDHRVIHHVEV